MIKLSEIRTGDCVEIMDIPKRCPLQMPLEQFGITVGSILRCRFFSPGSELVALEHEGTVIALRLRDLSRISVRFRT